MNYICRCPVMRLFCGISAGAFRFICHAVFSPEPCSPAPQFPAGAPCSGCMICRPLHWLCVSSDPTLSEFRLLFCDFITYYSIYRHFLRSLSDSIRGRASDHSFPAVITCPVIRIKQILPNIFLKVSAALPQSTERQCAKVLFLLVSGCCMQNGLSS